MTMITLGTNSLIENRKKLEELEELERDRIRRSRIIVMRDADLLEKYNDLALCITDTEVISRRPIDVSRLQQFIFDCNRLGKKCKVDADNMCDINSYKANPFNLHLMR